MLVLPEHCKSHDSGELVDGYKKSFTGQIELMIVKNIILFQKNSRLAFLRLESYYNTDAMVTHLHKMLSHCMEYS